MVKVRNRGWHKARPPHTPMPHINHAADEDHPGHTACGIKVERLPNRFAGKREPVTCNACERAINAQPHRMRAA